MTDYVEAELRWPDRYAVPSVVELRQSRLYWRPFHVDLQAHRGSGAPAQVRWVRPTPRLLDDFVRLGDGKEEEILRFAQQWGVLAICKHGVPSTHHPAFFPQGRFHSAHRSPGCEPLTDATGDWNWESLRRWRSYASQAHDILRLVDALKEKKLGSPKHWRRIFDRVRGRVFRTNKQPKARIIREVTPQQVRELWLQMLREVTLTPDEVEQTSRPPWRILGKILSDRSLEEYQRSGESLEEQTAQWLQSLRLRFGKVVDDWLRLGNVNVQCGWHQRDERPVPYVGGASLCGAIAVQLLYRVCGVLTISFCSGCGNPYTPTRLPAHNRRRFCHACGFKTANRLAQRDQRAKEARTAGRTPGRVGRPSKTR